MTHEPENIDDLPEDPDALALFDIEQQLARFLRGPEQASTVLENVRAIIAAHDRQSAQREAE